MNKQNAACIFSNVTSPQRNVAHHAETVVLTILVHVLHKICIANGNLTKSYAPTLKT